MARLQYTANGETREIPLDQKVTFGRAETNHVRLSHPDVSRVHAAIIRSANGHVLQDLNSRNGVLVNGQRETHAVLHSGDIVTIGSYHFTFVGEESLAGGATVAFRSPEPPSEAPLPQLAPAAEMPTTALKIASASPPPSPTPVPSAPPPATPPPAAPDEAGNAGPCDEIFFSLEDAVSSAAGPLADELNRMRQQLADILDRSTTASPAELAEALVEAAVEAIGADRGALVLRMKEGGLNLLACYPRTMRPNVSRVVLQATLRDRKAILCNRAFENRHFRTSPTMMRERVPGLVAVPVLRGGTSIGFFYMDTLEHTDLFRREHLPLLGFAGQLIVALNPVTAVLAPDPDGEVSDSGVFLAALNGRYLSASRRRMKKIEALQGLGQCASRNAVAALVAHLTDQDPHIADAAAAACISFARGSCSPETRDLLHEELLRLFGDAGQDRKNRPLEVLRQLQPARSPLRERLELFSSDQSLPAPVRAAARDLIGSADAPDSTFFLSSDSVSRQMDLRG